MASDRWTVPRLVRHYRESCRTARTSLLDDGLATEQELTDYWPGGDENGMPEPLCWIYCYGQYASFRRRAERQDEQKEGARDAAEQLAIDALRGAPIRVELDARDEAGVPLTLTVFPKSFHALTTIQEYDGLLARLGDCYTQVERAGGETFAHHAGDVLARINHYHRLIAWAISHAEPGLPWADDVTEPEPPAWTADLSPRDILALMQTNREVNGARIHAAIAILTGPTPSTSGERGSWSTLLAVFAKDQRISSRSAARDYTLESILATLALTNEQDRRAAQAAKGAAPATDLAPGLY